MKSLDFHWHLLNLERVVFVRPDSASDTAYGLIL